MSKSGDKRGLSPNTAVWDVPLLASVLHAGLRPLHRLIPSASLSDASRGALNANFGRRATGARG